MNNSAKPDKRPKSDSGGHKEPRRDGRADHVLVRNLFSLVVVRRIVVLVVIALMCAGLSVVSAIQVVKVKTPPQYIQLTQDGRIFPIAPLNVANVSDGEIMKFAAESVKWVNTYDYINWKDQLQSNAERFTPQGWNNYMTSLVASDNLNSVRERRMVVSTTFKGDVQILKQGVVKELNQYTWMVEVPVSVVFTAGAEGRSATSGDVMTQEGRVRLYVVRVPLEVNLRGYAIQIYQFKTGAE